MFSQLLTRNILAFSSMNVPRVSMQRYLTKTPGWEEDCKTCAKSLRDYGIMYIQDPRADYEYGWKLIDIMENYYDLRMKQLSQGMDGPELDIVDTQPPFGLIKPDNERYDGFEEVKRKLAPQHASHTPIRAQTDTTIRYSWDTLRDNNPLPKQFPQFGHVFGSFAKMQKAAAFTTAEMVAAGLGLPVDAIRKHLHKGAGISSPPAIHLKDFQPGDIMTSFHSDFTTLTVHSKCRFPGLLVWNRKGERFQPKVPDNHFLIHGGKQLEWLTGGYLQAAFHQVYYGQDTHAAKLKAVKEGKPLWRVSLPFFSHLDNDYVMSPFEHFRTAESVKDYPQITSQNFVNEELTRYYGDKA